jgi:hypothetical protein
MTIQETALFARQPFSIDEVSPEIQQTSRNTFSFLLKKMAQVSLESIGDKLHIHKSNVCRMKENGELEKASALIVAIGVDVVAMEEENNRLREENAAYQVLLAAKLNSQKEKPEVSAN